MSIPYPQLEQLGARRARRCGDERGRRAAGCAWRQPLIRHRPVGTRCLEVDGLTAPATAAQQLGDAVAQSGLGGGSEDAEVGLWIRLVIATLVLDKPIVLRCRVLEHPEGITRRAHP
jgi:hypothetical protein